MTVEARQKLNALDLLLQGHREIESLFREFEHRLQSHESTERAIENACMELDVHDALETGIFYPALRESADDATIKGLLDQTGKEHVNIRELIGEVRHAPSGGRDAFFARLVGHVQQHVAGEETQLFPQVSRLERLDMGAVTAAMMKRSTEMIARMEFPEAVEEAV